MHECLQLLLKHIPINVWCLNPGALQAPARHVVDLMGSPLQIKPQDSQLHAVNRIGMAQPDGTDKIGDIICN